MGVTLSIDGRCSAEVHIMIASAVATMARLNRILRCNIISFASSSSCTSIFSPPFFYLAVKHGPCLQTEKRIQAFETKCLRKLLRISYLDYKTNDSAWNKIDFLVAQEPLLATVKRRKLAWFGRHTSRRPLQNHPSWHFGGWAMPLSAEEMLNGQHQRVNIPANARIAHKGLLQKKKKT